MSMAYKAYYFSLFFGFGVISPLFAIYLQEVGLTGTQIGLVMAVGPLVSMFFQPVWGVVADQKQIPQPLIIWLSLAAALAVWGYIFSTQYAIILLTASLLALCQSALVPLGDRITLRHVEVSGKKYGHIRMWGSFGFALAVGISGWLAEATSLKVIFYMYMMAMLFSFFSARRLPNQAKTLEVKITGKLFFLLRQPQFLLLLLGNFFIFGTFSAQNTFFGLYYQAIGGTVAGVGLAFFLFASSEIPFMVWVDRVIRRFGLLTVLCLSIAISTFRWLYYVTEPSTLWILGTFFVQGLSVGFYLTAAVQMVYRMAPEETKATALTFFFLAGVGLGAMTLNGLGGWLMERYSVLAAYWMMFICSFFGFCAFAGIGLLERKGQRRRLPGETV